MSCTVDGIFTGIMISITSAALFFLLRFFYGLWREDIRDEAEKIASRAVHDSYLRTHSSEIFHRIAQLEATVFEKKNG